MIFIDAFIDNYFCVAFLISLMLSLAAPYLYVDNQGRENEEAKFGKLFYFKEFWHHFVSYSFGWYTLYLFIGYSQQVSSKDFSVAHIILLLISIIGIVGWLPYLIMGIIKAVGSIIIRLADKV